MKLKLSVPLFSARCASVEYLHQNPSQRGSEEWCPCPLEDWEGPLPPPPSFHCHWKRRSLKRRYWRWSHAWGRERRREGGGTQCKSDSNQPHTDRFQFQYKLYDYYYYMCWVRSENINNIVHTTRCFYKEREGGTKRGKEGET